MITSLLTLSVYAQSPSPELNHFATRGISFDYPTGYTVTDESAAEAQRFLLTRIGSSVQLTIFVMRRLTESDELPAAIDNFQESIIEKGGTTLGLANAPERAAIHAQLGSRQAEGVRLRSSSNSNRTGEVIWLEWNGRVVACPCQIRRR